jgi:hypothetical protein
MLPPHNQKPISSSVHHAASGGNLESPSNKFFTSSSPTPTKVFNPETASFEGKPNQNTAAQSQLEKNNEYATSGTAVSQSQQKCFFKLHPNEVNSTNLALTSTSLNEVLHYKQILGEVKATDNYKKRTEMVETNVGAATSKIQSTL